MKACPFPHALPTTRLIAGWLAFLAFALLSCVAQGQEFVVQGSLSRPLSCKLKFTLFNGDSTFQEQVRTVKEEFSFEGSVKGPTLASLSAADEGTGFPGVLYFFVEPGTVLVRLNVDAPESSPITGSRANSEYRYLLEGCNEEETKACLKRFVKEEPGSVFSPFIIDQYLKECPFEEFAAMVEQLEGKALHTYHFHLLEKRLMQLAQLLPGHLLPDFECRAENGGLSSFHWILEGGEYSLFVFGAQWCSACNLVYVEAKESFPRLNVHYFELNEEKGGWDSGPFRTLMVDRIPFLVLCDKRGRLVARDFSLWEVDGILEEYGAQ